MTVEADATAQASILIVEDEAIVAMDLQEHLREMGYAVCAVADNGLAAIAIAWERRPNLVLMDIVIKGNMDGIEAARQIWRGLHIPVIFLTAYSDPATVERAARVAPYGYLTKPFQANELRAAIEIALYKSKLERRLRDSEQWFASTLRCVADGVVATDAQCKVRFMNHAAETMLGWPQDEAIGRHIDEVAPIANPIDGTALASPVVRALAQGGVIGIEFGTMLRARDGSSLPVDDSAAPIIGEDGEALGAVMVFRDIRERLLAEQKLKQSEQYFRNLFELAPVGMALVGLDNHFLRVNGAVCSLLDYDAAALTGRDQSDVAYTDEGGEEQAVLVELLAGKTLSSQFEKRYRRKDGKVIETLVNVSLLRQRDEPVCYLWQIHDITEIKDVEARLARLAHFDPLTGLANRAQLNDEIERNILLARRHGWRMAVIFLDLDHFKQINDSLGHAGGDELLQAVAKTLLASVRQVDTVARMGGDEFVILLSELHTAEEVLVVTDKLREKCARPIHVGGQEVRVGISLGVSMCPDDAADARTLLRYADSALYHAKAVGRGNLQFYQPELMELVQQRIMLGADLRQALERQEFTLYYQPIVDLVNGRAVMAEALIRWQHTERGLLLPEEFIALTEEIGLIDQIGTWVLREACTAAAAWPECAGPPLMVSVNVSPSQFKSGRLVPAVREALCASGLAPQRLCIEITEQVLLEHSDRNMDAITQIKALGVKVAIDDFGAGYSSLGYISRISPDEIKIDASLMRDIATKPFDAAIIKAAVVMAHSLNLSVVSEGVESEAQRDFLSSIGCDMAQGFLFARPDSAAAFSHWLGAYQDSAAHT